MNLDLSILVVTYGNAAAVTRFHQELAASLAPHTGWEIRYHDNSPDKTVIDALGRAGVERARIVHDPANPGFAAGVNRLLDVADRARIALVNPDVFGFSADFWEQLVTTASPGQARFVRLVDDRGRMQDCVGRAPGLKRALSPARNWSAVSQPCPVETAIMAFMLTDRIAFERVGRLDERFWLYAEDLDWCWRARQAGVELIFDPRFELTHLGGQSADLVMSRHQQTRKKYRAEAMFIRKHFRGPHRLAMLALNRIKLLRCR